MLTEGRPVPHASHGAYERAIERNLELLAQVSDVDVDDVREAVVVHVPYVLQDAGSADHLARSAHQELEQRELASGQVDRLVVAGDRVGCRIQHDIVGRHGRRSLGRTAANERPEPGEELSEGERLHEVVVGARVEASDAILHPVARGEHQHRRPSALRSQLATDREPISAGQHHVQHDRVVVLVESPVQRVLAVRDGVNGIPFFLQAATHGPGHLELVFDHEDPHLRASLAPFHESWVRDPARKLRSHRSLILRDVDRAHG